MTRAGDVSRGCLEGGRGILGTSQFSMDVAHQVVCNGPIRFNDFTGFTKIPAKKNPKNFLGVPTFFFQKKKLIWLGDYSNNDFLKISLNPLSLRVLVLSEDHLLCHNGFP